MAAYRSDETARPTADAVPGPAAGPVSRPDAGAVIEGLANNLPAVPIVDLGEDATADQRLLARQFVAGAKAYRDTVRAYLFDAGVPW